MKILAACTILICATTSAVHGEEDPFAGGVDALALSESDGSMSLRAKKKVKKLGADMAMVRVKAVDTSKFPRCVLTAQVLRAPKSKEKHLKLLGRGKTYRFHAQLKSEKSGLDLSDKMTQANLGACYYPKKTQLIVRVSGVDLKSKTFALSEVHLKR